MSNPLHDNAPLWWDENGPFALLHTIAPLRMSWILKHVPTLSGLSILDVGCGGGLLCEPMARLCASVTGIDTSCDAIKAAIAHNPGLPIHYKEDAIETFPKTTLFDCVTAFEVIEHVDQPMAFLGHCRALLKPGGFLLGSTINRTPLAYFLGIVAAERFLKWVPSGTHDIAQCVTPKECTAMATAQGFAPPSYKGMSYSIRQRRFVFSDAKTINYYFAMQAL